MRIGMKRKWMKPVIAILVLLVLLTGCTIFIYYKNKKEELLQPEDSVEAIQPIYAMVKWQELMDKYDLEYDENVVRDMKKRYISIMKRTDIDNMDVIELVKVIYINSKWEIEEFNQYNTYLGEYYDTERDLFYNYKIEQLAPDAKEELYEQSVSTSYNVYMTLRDNFIYTDFFDVHAGLKQCYKNSTSTYDIVDILYAFCTADKLDSIDYMREKALFESLYEEQTAYYEKEFNVSDLDVNDFLIICKKMDIDTSELEKKLSEIVIDYNDDTLLFPCAQTDLRYANFVVMTFFDMLYYDYEYRYVEMNDILAGKLVKNYSDFYYNTLSEYLRQIDNMDR